MGTTRSEDERGRSNLFSRIAAEFTTKVWVLIPIGIGINVVIGVLVQALRLPLYLNTIGNILVGILAGPWAAALTGLLSTLVQGITAPTYIPFAVVSVAIGLTAGFLANRGMFKSYWKVAVSGVVITLVTVITAAPITVLVFGGVTGGTGSDFVTAIFLATGSELWSSVLKSTFIIEPVDKIVSVFVAFFIARAIPTRYRPERARRTLPHQSQDSPREA